MPPRPTLPPDDLYARLEIPADASPEAIEVAWRALLRQHHPDIAGPSGLERSKRINVAHDWLSDPDAALPLRPRARALRRSLRETGGRDPRDDGRAVRDEGRSVRHAAAPRPADPGEALARFLDRVATLEPDEIDRLACADPPPIAFGATIARFLPPDRLAALEAVEAAIAARLDPAAAARPGVRDAVEGYATELVLGPFLDDLLTEPFRDRARERLTRGWDAAVGQPRYGPNGDAVRALLARLATLDRAGVARPRRHGPACRRTAMAASEDPWPPDTSPDDDEALRVSSMLAAARRRRRGPGRPADRATTARARWSAARLAHLLVLRHAFAPRTFASLTRPWRPRFLPDDRPAPRVHRPGPQLTADGGRTRRRAPVRCSSRGAVAGRARGRRGGRRRRRRGRRRQADASADWTASAPRRARHPVATRSAAVTDLRDRAVRAETAAAAATLELDAFLGSLAQGVLVVGDGLRITRANAAAHGLLDRAPGTLRRVGR